jgi:6,7-dimethyl-8-ribityllumazine synthase
MAEANYKKFDIKKYPLKDIKSLSIGIVYTEWNTEIIDRLLNACKKNLKSLGIDPSNVHEAVVPGSFELPSGAKYMLNSSVKMDAIICLGCVIQGETKHDDYINHATAKAISALNLTSNTPVIFGLLTTNNKQQAIERSGGSRGDKGAECAMAALKMISLKEKLGASKGKISF